MGSLIAIGNSQIHAGGAIPGREGTIPDHTFLGEQDLPDDIKQRVERGFEVRRLEREEQLQQTSTPWYDWVAAFLGLEHRDIHSGMVLLDIRRNICDGKRFAVLEWTSEENVSGHDNGVVIHHCRCYTEICENQFQAICELVLAHIREDLIEIEIEKELNAAGIHASNVQARVQKLVALFLEEHGLDFETVERRRQEIAERVRARHPAGDK